MWQTAEANFVRPKAELLSWSAHDDTKLVIDLVILNKPPAILRHLVQVLLQCGVGIDLQAVFDFLDLILQRRAVGGNGAATGEERSQEKKEERSR
jgi:hypothetical protein